MGKRCLVAICTNWPYVPVETAQSLMEIGWGNRVERAKAAAGFDEISFHWSKGFPRVDALRDSAIELAQANGFTHVLFLDADNIWPSDTLERLLVNHERGIVGGLYVMRHAPYAPVALKDGFIPEGDSVIHYLHDKEAVHATELREVDVLGMGCTLIPLSVFDAIGERPWFEYRNNSAGWPVVTEDVPFCQKAKAAGVQIWLDPTISCGHVTGMVTDKRWATRYQQSQQATMDALPIKVVPLEVPA